MLYTKMFFTQLNKHKQFSLTETFLVYMCSQKYKVFIITFDAF